jgi:hypothetical protein
MIWFKDEDVRVHEDERVAIELGNGEKGATIYVIHKSAGVDGGVMLRRMVLEDMVEKR